MRNFSFKRKIATSLMFFALMASAQAEQLVIEENSGKTTFYDLGSKPVISYSGDNLVVKTSLANATFSLNQVAKYYFKMDATGNSDIENANEAFIAVSEERFSMRNGVAGSPVTLLSIDGKIISSHIVASDGSLEFSLDGLSQGIYIIKTNSANIKLIRK